MNLIVDNRWLIAVARTVVTAIGTGFAVVLPPVYQSNMLIQVEDSSGSAKVDFLTA